MALDKLIPEIWAPRLLGKLHKEQIAAKLANTEYEGLIKQAGDTVRITSIGNITITPYTKNTDLADPETLTDAEATLVIDQSPAFNFQVDDIEAAQAKPKVMDEAMGEAAYALADESDQHIFEKMAAGAHADNKFGTDAAPIDVTGSTFAGYYALAVELRKRLNKKNIKKDGRFLVVDPDVEAELLLDERFSKSGTDLSDETVTKGLIGRIAGFDVYVSNNVPVVDGDTGEAHKVIAGTKEATSFAGQIDKIESYRLEKRFADGVKGLYLYGCKVVRPDALAVATLDLAGTYTEATVS